MNEQKAQTINRSCLEFPFTFGPAQARNERTTLGSLREYFKRVFCIWTGSEGSYRNGFWTTANNANYESKTNVYSDLPSLGSCVSSVDRPDLFFFVLLYFGAGQQQSGHSAVNKIVAATETGRLSTFCSYFIFSHPQTTAPQVTGSEGRRRQTFGAVLLFRLAI